MSSPAGQNADAEMHFARLVDAWASGSAAEENLLDLLREDHPEYSQRNSSAVVRMRGWVLLALSRIHISDVALPFVLEELQSGTDSYLIAAGARALRTYPLPAPSLTPIVLQALRNTPEEPICFAGYGQYAIQGDETTPTKELLAVLEWLGANAICALPELMSMKQENAVPRRLRSQLKQTIDAIRTARPILKDRRENCCVDATSLGWSVPNHPALALPSAVESIVFQDQDGQEVRYGEFFLRIPSVVAFFYTRCDNPWKCSLTVTKLARLQRAFRELGLSERVKMAAITYDPDFDQAHRLRAYGQERGMNFTMTDRMLRTTEGFETLRSHFDLGVGFAGPLVNRHQIELYLLNHSGEITAKFSRLQWDESDVVNRVSELLKENRSRTSLAQPKFAFLSILLSLAWAFFPKCPMCWASYASAFGILGLADSRYPSHLAYILPALFFLNLAALWARTRARKEPAVFWLASLGALLIVLGRSIGSGSNIAHGGTILTVLASLWAAFLPRSNPTVIQTSVQRLLSCWRLFHRSPNIAASKASSAPKVSEATN